MLLKDGDYFYFDDIIVKIKELPNPERELIKEVIALCKLILVNPATSAAGERSFPTARRLKTWLRSRTNQARFKVRIHGAILRAMAKLHRVSTPKIVARNIAAVEFRSTSVTLRATNFFVYPPSAAFRAILWRKFQCSANQISHSNLTADLNVTRRTFHVKRKRWFNLPKKGVR